MHYEAVADLVYPGDWRVEAYDGEGACFVTMFSGPLAQGRAEEYAAFKNESK